MTIIWNCFAESLYFQGLSRHWLSNDEKKLFAAITNNIRIRKKRADDLFFCFKII